MSHNHTRILIHIVFAVKYRINLLKDSFRYDLFKFIFGILRDLKSNPICVGGYKDHVHILINCPPAISLSEIVGKVKSRSSKWINEMKFFPERFQWQSGYGAFSHGYSSSHTVVNYINNQEEHHKYRSFKKEYLKILETHQINYDETTSFEFYEE